MNPAKTPHEGKMYIFNFFFFLLTIISAAGFDFPKWIGQDAKGCRQLKASEVLTTRRALQGHPPR